MNRIAYLSEEKILYAERYIGGFRIKPIQVHKVQFLMEIQIAAFGIYN